MKISQVDFLWNWTFGCWRLIIVSVYKIAQLCIYICWWDSCLYLGCCITYASMLILYFTLLYIELLPHMALYCDYGFVGSKGGFPLHIDVYITVHCYSTYSSLDVIAQMNVLICMWSRRIYLGGSSMSVDKSLLSLTPGVELIKN